MTGWFDSMLDWLRSLFFKQEMELSLIGLQNAGKSSFVNVLIMGAHTDDMIPTVGFNMRKVRAQPCWHQCRLYFSLIPSELVPLTNSPRGA